MLQKKNHFYTVHDLPVQQKWQKKYFSASCIQYFISAIYVINLESSQMRWHDIHKELQQFFSEDDYIDFFRFPAVRRENGALGCLLSHLLVLDHAQHRNYPFVLVLEDDFTFSVTRYQLDEQLRHVNEVFGSDFDVIQFGQYCYRWSKVKGSDCLMRLHQASSTSGYLIRKDFIPILKQIWLQHLRDLQFKSFHPERDPLDKIQYRSQNIGIWLGFREPLGRQRPVWSTIENRFMENRWSCSDDLQTWYDSSNTGRPLELLPTRSAEEIKDERKNYRIDSPFFTS